MLELKTVNLKRTKLDTLVVPVCEDGGIHSDKTLSSMVAEAKTMLEFNGKAGQVLTLFSLSAPGSSVRFLSGSENAMT